MGRARGGAGHVRPVAATCGPLVPRARRRPLELALAATEREKDDGAGLLRLLLRTLPHQ